LAIWASIQLDARHFDVELVSFVPINKRSTLEGCMLFAGNHDLCTRQVLSYINANASELFPELALQAVWKKIKKQIVASAHGTYPEDENSFSTPSTFGPLVGSFN
jgi:hypothetical protein